MKNILHIVFIVSLILLFSCNDDLLLKENATVYSKIYSSLEDIEAVDFIPKPDGSGFLILANNKNTTNSNIYLISTDNEGYIDSTYHIKTEFYDQGKTLKSQGNDIYVLGNRRENLEARISRALLLKAEANGKPVKASDDTTTVIAEIKILAAKNTQSITMNDMLMDNGGSIYFAGAVQRLPNTVTNEIIQIYNLSEFNFQSSSPYKGQIEEIPRNLNDISYTYNNSRINRIIKENFSNYKSTYTTIGHAVSSNATGNIAPPSENIVRKIYEENLSSAADVKFLGDERNENLGAILLHKNNNSLFVGGSYQDNDSLFLIRTTYDPLNIDNENPVFTQTRYSFSGYGNKIVSMSQNYSGDIIMATTENFDVTEGALPEKSYLLKFSEAGLPIESEVFTLQNSKYYNIKKILSQDDNSIMILSNLEFENTSKSVGLLKIYF